MSTRPCTKTLALALFLLFPALALITPSASEAPEAAPENAWDQEAVTRLAGELAVEVKDLRKALKRGPGSSMATMQEHARYNFMDILRLIESETGYLSRRLSEGSGHAETYPVYHRLMRLVHDAAREGERLFIDEPTKERIDKAGAILDELNGYFEPPEPAES